MGSQCLYFWLLQLLQIYIFSNGMGHKKRRLMLPDYLPISWSNFNHPSLFCTTVQTFHNPLFKCLGAITLFFSRLSFQFLIVFWKFPTTAAKGYPTCHWYPPNLRGVIPVVGCTSSNQYRNSLLRKHNENPRARKADKTHTVVPFGLPGHPFTGSFPIPGNYGIKNDDDNYNYEAAPFPGINLCFLIRRQIFIIPLRFFPQLAPAICGIWVVGFTLSHGLLIKKFLFCSLIFLLGNGASIK